MAQFSSPKISFGSLLLLILLHLSAVNCFRGNFILPKIAATSIPGSQGTRTVTLAFQILDQIDSNRTTSCSISFPTFTIAGNSTNAKSIPDLPGQWNPGRCSDSGFSWYFTSFDSVHNFTINAAHSYQDPKIGPGYVTYFAYGNPINTKEVQQWKCGSVRGFEFCNYMDKANPIELPVMAAIA